MCVLLEFNPITVTALSRGTCDCASDLGRDTPFYSCCLCLRPLRPRSPSSPRSCPYGLSGIPHRRPWLRNQYPYLRAHDTPRSNPMKKEKKRVQVSPAASDKQQQHFRGEHRAVSTSSGSITAVLYAATLPVPIVWGHVDEMSAGLCRVKSFRV